MRSAADMDEVGCPESAAAAERTESTRSCCPSSRHCSYLSIPAPPRSPVPAADDTHLVAASRAVNAGTRRSRDRSRVGAWPPGLSSAPPCSRCSSPAPPRRPRSTRRRAGRRAARRASGSTAAATSPSRSTAPASYRGMSSCTSRSGCRTTRPRASCSSSQAGRASRRPYSFDEPEELWDGLDAGRLRQPRHRPVEPDRLRAVRRPRHARRHHALQRPARPGARLLLDARQRRRHGGGPQGPRRRQARALGDVVRDEAGARLRAAVPVPRRRLLLDSTVLPAEHDVYDLQ